ncbi:MAG TPA: tetratricopeptide repeat protein [Rhizomicrobium sp.]|nr:tetratricopeptide repeat protein [Rhizomicrobium sp.]
MATNGPFFRRAVPPDRTAFLAEIERRRAALAEARAAGDGAAVRDAAGGLGSMLFWIEGSEGEAAALLSEALALSRAQGDRTTEIDGLLGLGTAVQYLGERERSVALFEEGLALCAASGIRGQEHFLLHHLGRCLVEMGRIEAARTAFEKALAIRKTLGDPRFLGSTQAALDDIAKMA